MKDAIRKHQAAELADRDMEGSKITAPGAQVGGYFGFGKHTFDYISKEQEPSGVVAKGAITRMITELNTAE